MFTFCFDAGMQTYRQTFTNWSQFGQSDLPPFPNQRMFTVLQTFVKLCIGFYLQNQSQILIQGIEVKWLWRSLSRKELSKTNPTRVLCGFRSMKKKSESCWNFQTLFAKCFLSERTITSSRMSFRYIFLFMPTPESNKIRGAFMLQKTLSRDKFGFLMMVNSGRLLFDKTSFWLIKYWSNNNITLTIVWLFPENSFSPRTVGPVKNQDPLLTLSWSSLQQLSAPFKPYSFIFIGEKLRIFDLVMTQIQFLFGYKSIWFTSIPCLPRYFSHRHLRIFCVRFS